MNWERAIGPGWGDPLLGQVPAQGGGASPLLWLAIIVMLVAVLVIVCEPRRG